MSLKNGLYLFREACSSVPLKGSQLPRQTDPYPCSRLGWVILNEHNSPLFTPLCTSMGEAWWWDFMGKVTCGCPGDCSNNAVSSVVWHLQRVSTFGGIFLGDGLLCPSPAGTLPYEKKAWGFVNKHALPFKYITGLAVLPPLLLFFSSLASFLWKLLFSSFLLYFSLPLTFCLANWLFLLCLSFFPSLPSLWQKVTRCSCWEHLPDDCENKLWLVDCWRKWQMPLPKWLPHKCQKTERWNQVIFRAEMYPLYQDLNS